jgi:hypothetical protein
LERIWTIIAGLGIVVAAAFLLQDNMTVAFVAATLGVVAWFLSLRDRLRKNIIATGEDHEEDTNGDRDED